MGANQKVQEINVKLNKCKRKSEIKFINYQYVLVF